MFFWNIYSIKFDFIELLIRKYIYPKRKLIFEVKMDIDEKDKEILRELQKDCKQSPQKIGNKLNLPTTTVYHRIKKLEAEKIITGYHARVDAAKVGRGAIAYVFMEIVGPRGTKTLKDHLYSVQKKLAKIPDVKECYIMTGTDDIVVKILGLNEKEVATFVIDKLSEMPEITKTRTCIVLNTAKNVPEVYIP